MGAEEGFGPLMAGSVRGVEQEPLAGVLDGHLSAGRRFVRVHLGGVHAVDPSVVTELHRTHGAFLARRGTLILTGVGTDLHTALVGDRFGADLFVLAPTADEESIAAPS